MTKTILAIATLVLLNSCVTLPSVMSAKTGCPEDDMTYTQANANYGMTLGQFKVSCRGRKFICTLAPNYGGSTNMNDMSCSPAL